MFLIRPKNQKWSDVENSYFSVDPNLLQSGMLNPAQEYMIKCQNVNK